MTSPDDARRALAAADPALTLTPEAPGLDDLRALPELDAGDGRVVELATGRRRLGRRTGIALGLAALTAVGGTAAAVTLWREPAAEVAGVECMTAHGESLVIGSTGSDPVERCRQMVRDMTHQDIAADAVAYQQPGRVPVVGSRASMPDGATVLTTPGPDVRLAELHHALTDQFAGVGFEANRPCQDLETTRKAVEALIARLGVTGYTFETRTVDPGATDRCVYAAVAPETHRIVLEKRASPAGAPAPETDPQVAKYATFARLVGARSRALTAHGASAAAMTTMVREAAAQTGVEAASYDVEVVRSPVAGPARLYYEMGGKDFFHIYAPAGD